MTRPTTRTAALLALAALIAGCSSPEQDVDPAAATPPAVVSPTAAEPPVSLYGRVTTYGGTTYEGPLRWGGGEEAFWGHYFNGVKDENPWAAHTPLGRRAGERRPPQIFGLELPWGRPETDLSRPFMARFGDIARIESYGDGVQGVIEDGVEFDPDVRVTLKSGTAFNLDRLSASDFDDGVRVWDERRGVVDLGPNRVRSIELFSPDQPRDVPDRLHGTVRTRQGDFTGFLQWNREASVGRDVLVGRAEDGGADGGADGEVRLRFDRIRSIVPSSGTSAMVTLRDGREIALSGTRQLTISGTREVGLGERGIYVDDPRYGRVLVSWDALERVDFSPGGSGPSYDDFPPGRPLAGSVTTRDGRRLAGRLVYDLDESETTETLDAPSGGVDYTLPFGLVASIVIPGDGGPATVTLQSGEELELDRAGDLGGGNAGVLVFADGRERSEYVPWAEVDRIDFDRPSATYPPAETNPVAGR